MKTREQNELRVDTGNTLRNPLLAFVGRHYYAPPAEGQAPSVAWQTDPEGRALRLPRLAGQLHMDLPTLRALLYDVASLSTSRRPTCATVSSVMSARPPANSVPRYVANTMNTAPPSSGHAC